MTCRGKATFSPARLARACGGGAGQRSSFASETRGGSAPLGVMGTFSQADALTTPPLASSSHWREQVERTGLRARKLRWRVGARSLPPSQRAPTRSHSPMLSAVDTSAAEPCPCFSFSSPASRARISRYTSRRVNVSSPHHANASCVLSPSSWTSDRSARPARCSQSLTAASRSASATATASPQLAHRRSRCTRSCRTLARASRARALACCLTACFRTLRTSFDL